MKFLYLPLFVLGAFLFTSHMFEHEYDLISICGSEPNLPKSPFKYSMKIPDKLRFSNRYGGISTVDLSRINNINDNLATLGRVLFYDKMLSVNNSISCSSCHIQANSFAQNSAFSNGQFNPTKRNSLHLNDLFWAGDPDFFWDKKRIPLEEAIRLPLKDENEISASDTVAMVNRLKATSYYEDLFMKAYGSPSITTTRAVNALKEFIISINTNGSKADQFALGHDNALSPEQKKGAIIFRRKCGSCHNGAFSRDLDGGNGLEAKYKDKGAGNNYGPDADGIFKAVNLRNITLTAPYMHDGRFNTLEKVIEFYSEGIKDHKGAQHLPIGGFKFTDKEKKNLLSFMHALTDSSITFRERWSDPFDYSSSSNDLNNTSFEVFPNPSNSFVQIACENCTTSTVAELLTIDGKSISKKVLKEGMASWQPKNSGAYMVRLFDNSKLLGSRIVVVK